MIGGLDGNRMLLGLAVGIIVLIFLVLKTKVQAFLALIVCTVIVGVVGGMPLSNITLEDGTTLGIVNSITGGFGSTLGSIGIIIGFGVKLDGQAKTTADNEDVDIRFYSVIYHAINDIEAALHGMLEPIYEKQEIGKAEIRQIFKASGVGNIAGSIVTEGKLKARALCTILRDGNVIYDGKIASLKRFKDEVKEVKGGYECGLVFEDFGNIQEGDIVVASEMVEIPR